MGEGHIIKCSNCGTEYMVDTGIGMLFPKVYGDTVEDIKAGKYGEEAKELFMSKPYKAVDCEYDLYVCECGNWNVEENLDIYEISDESRMKERYPAEEGHGYVMREDLEEYFKLIMPHVHVCERCGKPMKRIKRPDYYVRQYGLKCPDCGTKNKADLSTRILWD